MQYVQQFNINGVITKQVACIELQGKPNAATEGYVGVLGIDVLSPLHEVYKCVAKNGSVYTWELLSSGTGILTSIITGAGEELFEFPYNKLKTVANYIVKIGDVILDKEGFLYQVESINATSCMASYNGTQIVSGIPKVGEVDNGKILSVVDGCHTFVNVEDSSVARYVEETVSPPLSSIAPYSLVQPDENGEFPLEVGKTYKVFFTHQQGIHSGDMLKATYYKRSSVYGGEDEFITTNTSINYSQYESINYFTITLLAVNISSAGYGEIQVVYSVDGKELTWYPLTADAKLYLNGNKPVTVSMIGATKCLLQNEEPYSR